MQKDRYSVNMRGGKKIKIVAVPPEQLERLLKRGSGPLMDEDVFDVKELVSSLAIEIWRLEKRIDKAKNSLINSLNKESVYILDQMQRIKDVFKKQEIEFCEHTGTAYNDGLSLKVLHVEEVDGLPKGKMQVIETVKPSVYFKGQVIFYGEVIVGKSNEK